jgi:hypothetical protein
MCSATTPIDSRSTADYSLEEIVSLNPLGSVASNARLPHGVSCGSVSSTIHAFFASAASWSMFCDVSTISRMPTPFCRSRPFAQSS